MSTEEPTPHLRFEQHWLHAIGSFLALLGIFEMLRTGIGSVTDPVGTGLFGYPAHFTAGVLHAVVGIAAIAAARRRLLTHYFLTGMAVLMVAWAGAGLLLDGEPNDAFTAAGVFVGMHLLVAVVCAFVLVRVARHGQGHPERHAMSDA